MTDPITSKSNERLVALRKLQQRKHRDRSGLFVAEGEDLVAEALRSGKRPRAVFYDPRRVTPEDPLLAGAGEAVAVASDALDAVSGLGSGSRVIGVFEQRWYSPEDLDEPVALYLHEVADPGNVGAVLRSALALAPAAVVLSPGSADPFGPKAVRASMGAIFGQPIARAGFEQARDAHAGHRSVALVPGAGRPLREAATPAPVLFCLGAEREGLPASIADACDERAHIPQREGGAESLNVAMAATLCLYEASVHTLSSR
jgi:TrmH family RNA methyltransferase